MGKVILLNIVIYLFTFFWSLLFVIPGIIAAYRYRFALYNLYENPGIGVMEALNMSKQQTLGYKGQLFMLDLSYIGWLLLASLTSVVQTGYIYACIFQDPGYYLANPAQVYAITPAHARRIAGGAGLCLAAAGGAVLPTGLPVHGAWLF